MITVAEAFKLAGHPVPEGMRISFTDYQWIAKQRGGHSATWNWTDRRWMYEFHNVPIDMSNLPARDAWERLPEVVREHPDVKKAMEGENGKR